MDRISELLEKVHSIDFLKRFLDVLRERHGIKIELSDQELLSIVNEIMPVEAPRETVGIHHVEIVKSDYKGTEAKILKAIEYCKENGVKLTIRNIAERAGVSKSTVHRYYDLIDKYSG